MNTVIQWANIVHQAELEVESNERKTSLDESSIHSYIPDEHSPSAYEVEPTLKLNTSQKLKQVFDLPSIEEYVTEFPCWLVKNIVLKGHLFLTTQSLCFYARLATDENIFLEGYLQKYSNSKKMSIRHWFSLKKDQLFYYDSPDDSYFPNGSIQLKDVVEIRVSKSNATKFKLVTAQKRYVLQAPTHQLMIEWKSSIEKAVFKARNSGDAIKIVIPLVYLLDISLVHSDSFGDAIILQVNDREPQQNVKIPEIDEYFLTNMHDSRAVFEAISKISKTLDDQIISEPYETSNSKESTESSLSIRVLSYLKRKPRQVTAQTSKTEDLVLPKIFPSLSDSDVVFSTNAYFFNGPASYGIPKFGKIYLTSDKILFHSKLVGIRTRALIPISDVIDAQRVEKYLGFWYGTYLKLGKSEIWIEFRTLNAREKFMDILSLSVHRKSESDFNISQKSIMDSEVDFASDDEATPRNRRKSVSSALLDQIHLKDANFIPVMNSTAHDDAIAELLKNEPLKFGLDGEKLKISLFTIGSRGDVQPLIALGKGLAKHGHICTIATHLEYKEWVEYHGLNFKEVCGNPAEIMQLCVDNGLFTYSFFKEAYNKCRDWLDELFVSTYEALKGSDVIIESAVALAGYHAACKLQVPYFGCCPMPWTRTSEFAHPFAISEKYGGYSYNSMTWLLMETVLWRGLQPQINRFRKKVLNVEPLSSGNWYEEEEIPFLYAFSDAVVKRPTDWKEWIHLTGYWFLDNSDTNWSPSAELENFMKDEESGKPLVYIGFGSIVVSDPDDLTRVIIEAVRKSGVRAIISKGWSARGQKVKQEPTHDHDPDVFFLTSAPHDWLFPKVAAVVHHGGAGTTAAGLRFGVPTIIKPFFGDQYFWANRVQQLGVGIHLKKLDSELLCEALVKVVNSDSMMLKAKEISDRIKAEDGIENAILIIRKNIPALRCKIKQKAIASKNINRGDSYTSILKKTLWGSTSPIESTHEDNEIELEQTDYATRTPKDKTPLSMITFDNVSFPNRKSLLHYRSSDGISGGGYGSDYEPVSPAKSKSSYCSRKSQYESGDESSTLSPSLPPSTRAGSISIESVKLQLPNSETCSSPPSPPKFQAKHRVNKSDSGVLRANTTVEEKPFNARKKSVFQRLIWGEK